jgi:hypothetical protein
MCGLVCIYVPIWHTPIFFLPFLFFLQDKYTNNVQYNFHILWLHRKNQQLNSIIMKKTPQTSTPNVPSTVSVPMQIGMWVCALATLLLIVCCVAVSLVAAWLLAVFGTCVLNALLTAGLIVAILTSTAVGVFLTLSCLCAVWIWAACQVAVWLDSIFNARQPSGALHNS